MVFVEEIIEEDLEDCKVCEAGFVFYDKVVTVVSECVD